MNERHLRLAARLTVGALAGLTALGASAQQGAESILYTYQGQALTDSWRDARAGSSGAKIHDPGVAFSFYLKAPLEAGESVSFKDAQGWYSFEGVMGEAGVFKTWDFQMWKASEYEEHSHYSEGLGSDGSRWYGTSYISKWNSHQPGVWTTTVVTELPAGSLYNTAYAIPWVNPVPEANASVMAMLGLAAVGVLAGRKAKAQAAAQTTA